MGWTRKARRTARCPIRPGVEDLEGRTLLSVGSHPPQVHHLQSLHRPAHARAAHGAPMRPAAAHTADSSVTPAITGATNYDGLIHASEVWKDYGVTGQGATVAVIDTGVDYNNEALGGGFGPGHKVAEGYDFADGTADPMATVSQHGTAVAGLIASNDPDHPGVAPGADIAALRVFGTSDSGDFTKVADALQWVIDNHTQDNITAVNLSIADGNNYAQNWFANDNGVGQQITGLIQQLDALNIPVITAAGNSYAGQQGMGFPAIVPATISVTASDISDHLLSNAQRLGGATGGASATDLSAPGQGLLAPSGDKGFASGDGTSFATPMVTGAVVLLQQIYESRFGGQLPTVAQLDSWLTQGADLATDPTSGFTIPRLDVAKAAAQIPNPAAETLTPPPTSSPSPSSSSSGSSGSSQPSTPPASGSSSSPGSSDSSTSGGTDGQWHYYINGQAVDGSDPSSLVARWAAGFAKAAGGSSADAGTVQIWGSVPGVTDVGKTVPTGHLSGARVVGGAHAARWHSAIVRPRHTR